MDKTLTPTERPAIAANPPVDTGLVTAAVTEAKLPGGWTVPKFLALIDALARNLYDEDFVLKEYGLTKKQFSILSANDWFKTSVEAASLQWRAAENVHQRLAIETALALEKAMPDLTARLSRNTEPLPGVVALAKLFAEISGTVGQKAADSPKEKFKITINLGADVQQFDKSITIENNIVEAGAGPPLQAIDKGA